MPTAPIDRRAFRQALGNFATGVTIVTTRDAAGVPVGLTANSFNSVSLDPPMVLWSLALDSANLAAFRDAPSWAVHVLAADQEAMSARFASRGIDKFSGLNLRDGGEGAPQIEGSAARFGCKASFEYEGGDHAIFVGEVVEFSATSGAPLLFHGGRYARVMPQAARVRPAETVDDGEFGRYFIGHVLGAARRAAFADLAPEYRRRGLNAAEYTVVAALGLGDGCSRRDLAARAATAGAKLAEDTIAGLVARGELAVDGEAVHLTATGRRLLTELVAVAQATQLRFEQVLTPSEMDLMHDMLIRMIAAADR